MPLQLVVENKPKRSPARKRSKGGPTPNQLQWLSRGLDQAGGKLPLFDENGQRVSERTIHSCLQRGWAKPWFNNPIKPDWQVCGLTDAGRDLFSGT
ncbi:MAG: hypothetical protein HN377_09175 [Alphaproteobacteria bacterium]|nr:hypothetical protein [Alphaproteobacteria bacterium]MBT7944470.1 hypothetical protein [Alphaproteobacteria bacterium]